MRYSLYVGAAAMAFVLVGCGDRMAEKREQARLRWDTARGKVQFRLAEQAYENGNLGRCKDQLAKVLSADRPYAPAYLLAARVAMREDRFSEAQEYLNVLVQESPLSAEGWYALGLLEEHKGDMDAALEAVARARALEVNNPEYLLCESEMYVRRGDPDQALAALEAVEDRFSMHAGVQSALADLYIMVGRDQQAVPCLRRVLRVNSDDRLASEQLALCLARTREPRRAVRIIERLIEKHGEVPLSVRVAQADCYTQLGRYEQAKAGYAALCKRQPNNPDWNFHLAECHAMLNEDRQAMDRLERVLEAAPKHADARALAGYLHFTAGDLEKARSALQQAIDGVEDPTLVAVALTHTLHRLGRDREAREVWAEYGNVVQTGRDRGVVDRMAVLEPEGTELVGGASGEVEKR